MQVFQFIQNHSFMDWAVITLTLFTVNYKLMLSVDTLNTDIFSLSKLFFNFSITKFT